MSQMKDPVGDGLSLHFFTVHGGWYEDGARFQAVKQIQQVIQDTGNFVKRNLNLRENLLIWQRPWKPRREVCCINLICMLLED